MEQLMNLIKKHIDRATNNSFSSIINPITLRFKSSLETKFQKHYFDSSISLFRMAFVLGIIYYSSFAFLDSIVATKELSSLLCIRFCIVVPSIFIIFLLSYTKSFIKWWQLAASIISLIAGIGIIAMIIINPTVGKNTYYVGLILVLIYTYTIIQLRFIWASTIGFIILIIYALANILHLTEQFEYFKINLFFLISADILGMFAAYFLELYARKQFYYQYELHEKDKTLNDINSHLEKRILEKTTKLKNDIKEKEDMTQKILSNERKFRFLAENSVDLIWLCDTNLNIEYISPIIKDLFGYEPEDIIGRNLSDFLQEEDFTALANIAVSYLKNPKKNTQMIYETNLYKKDGSLIPIELRGKLNIDEQGNPLGFQGIARNLLKKRIYERKLEKNLYEKDLLIKEIYHRTKNNMQIFTSLIRILNTKIEDENIKSALKDIEDKVYSMSLVHQQLYEEKDLSNISMQNYINSLLRYMNSAHLEKIKKIDISVTIEDFSLSIDYAIPFSIILTELFGNILKFIDIKKNPKISIVSYKPDDDTVNFKVVVNQILPIMHTGSDFSNHLDLVNIENIALHQLKGKLDLINDKYFMFSIEFKNIFYKNRI